MISKYYNIVERHIKPELGSWDVRDISVQMAVDFSEELMKILSPKSVKDVLVVLHSVLKYVGIEMDMPYPRVRAQEMRVLSAAEQRLLTEQLLGSGDRRDLGILLALLTGMRIGELCALRWENISMENRTIFVRSTMQRLQCQDTEQKTRVIITSPKSEKSVRLIPMTELAFRICQQIWTEEGFFLTGTEKYLEPRCMQYRMAYVAKECGLEGVHFHTLRHTFATRCVEVGFELKSLSEVMGHSATTVTLERYIHASLQMKRDNMRRLEEIGM